MMDLTMMLNMTEIKPSNTHLSKLSKGDSTFSVNISDKKENSRFENMIKKEDKPLKESPKKRVEVDKKDKDNLIREIEEKIEDDYKDEDKFNILNIGLLLDMLNNDKKLNIDTIELVPVQNTEINEDLIGVFELKDSTLNVPILISDSNELNTVDVLEDIKNKVDTVLEELNLEPLREQLTEIFENQEEKFEDKKTNSFLENENFDIEDMVFSDNLQLEDDMKSFKDFLMSQRLSQLEIKSKNDNKNDLETLIKELDLDTNNEVDVMLGSDSYGLKTPINDTIKSSVLPEIINYNVINKDISQVVNFMKTSDIKELTLKVRPKELGEITIHLLKGSESNIVISVEKEQLFNSLKHNLMSLTNELKDLGLKVDNIEILMKSDDANNSTFMSNSNKENSKNQNDQGKQNNKLNNTIKDINQDEIHINKETDNQVDMLA